MDREEFINFYNKYYERTLRILYRKLGDVVVAEDKAQEIFTSIYQKSPTDPKAYIKNVRHQYREAFIENAQLDLRERVEKELSVDFKDYWDKIKKMEFLGHETCTLSIFFCYIEENSKKHEVAQQFGLDPKTLSARVAEVKKRVIITIYLLQGESLEYIVKQINLPQQKIREIYQQIKRWLKEHGNE